MLAVAVVVAITGDGGGDAEPAARQIEPDPEPSEAGGPPLADRRARGPEPGDRATVPERGRSSGGEPQAPDEELDRLADILRSDAPLKRAKRAGIEVLRATPGGADEVYEILGKESGTLEKLLGGSP